MIEVKSKKSLEFVPVVDAHAHIFTQNMPLNDEPRHSPNYDFTVENYIQTLDKHKVTYGVIAAASPWSDYNDYIIDSVKNDPRLRGTVIVKPSVEKYILEFMKRDGIVGVRLPFIGLKEKPDLKSFEYRRLLKRIAELDWHVHLHVEGDYLCELLPLLEASGVKIVVDHMGRMNSVTGENKKAFEALVSSVNNGRTWVKTSCAYRIGEGAENIFSALLDHVSHERLLWASDCPFVGKENEITYQETIDWFFERISNEDSQRKIFSDNALKFYGFENE